MRQAQLDARGEGVEVEHTNLAQEQMNILSDMMRTETEQNQLMIPMIMDLV